jgi:tetratricopeptide (TPR) repeat protein
MVAQDRLKTLRLVEIERERILARLVSPDLCQAQWATFSPDGSRLVVTTNDGPAVHVWDLRAIRRHLVELSLDWDAPAFSDDDTACPATPRLPRLEIDYGKLAVHLQHHSESPEDLIGRYTARLKQRSDDADAYHHRAHALANLRRYSEAVDDLTQAIRLEPREAHYRTMRGGIHLDQQRLEPAIADLEAALALQPDAPNIAEWLAEACNNRAWALALAPEPKRDLDRALTLCQRALAVDTAGEALHLNTLGVVQYRAGRYDEATATLERSLACGTGLSDGFDLFFLAMAHQRLGHTEKARDCFDRGIHWLGDQQGLNERETRELAAFRTEAAAVLAVPVVKLPDEVFAAPD